MKGLLRVQLAILLLISTAWARVIYGGLIVDWGTHHLGKSDVRILPKGIWSIINNAASNFYGNVKVERDGGLYISAVSPRVVLHATLMDHFHYFVNNGVVSFNAIRGAPGYLFKIIGNKFENNGDLFFSASGKASVVSGIMSRDWRNNGYIQVYQAMKSHSYTYLGYPGKSIINNGQVCFTNQNFKQRTNILGRGCFTAQGKSSFYFMNTNLKISEDQIFYLADGETSIMADGSIHHPQTFHVRGFGTINGVANKIGLTSGLYHKVHGRPPFTYDARRGILTLYHGLYSQRFEIGTGYDYRRFRIVSDRCWGLPWVASGVIQYNGPLPHPGMPPQCKPCKPIPGIPGIDKPPTTSYPIETGPETSFPGPTEEPTDEPTDGSTLAPTDEPTLSPTDESTSVPENTTTEPITTENPPHIKTVTVVITTTTYSTTYTTETDYVTY
ncbi:hypothetical protein I9W82_001819 [Candida metapsilosis]|uniref:Hyphally-regulated cell wall protein N-terminal domain-containing protein n=1 Tax=Candida metapsilosis TaxID=273372 RepID=A0A8H7ZGZ6_9ASCO|nr:hypothetical protein I9W82_001819 [Candida metapsilosis]